MSKPNIKVQGKVSDFHKKEKNETIKHSNFFLTINTNQQYKNDEKLNDDTEIFNNVVSNVLNNLNEYVNLPNGVLWSDETIKDVFIDYVIELGGIKHSLHCHIYIKITHNTNVKLNFKKIKEDICNQLGLNNIHMMNRMVRSNNENVLDYINKYIKK